MFDFKCYSELVGVLDVLLSVLWTHQIHLFPCMMCWSPMVDCLVIPCLIGRFPLHPHICMCWFPLQEAHLSRVHHLYRKCEDAPLRVSAQRGKAVLWYNHMVDAATGWMGELDEYTLHGGCPVKHGEKWIANFWIKTTDDKAQDLQRMKKFHHDEL